MIHDDPGILSLILLIATGVFGFGVLFSAWRLIVGPSLPDRVVALDLIGFLVVGALCIFSMMTDRTSLLFIALVAALILFLGTAAFAVYLEKRETT